ncbi:MAG: ABC transporter substrate-binding protein [Chloroflexi bacterium]|nr:ABC transporter substrate-binding protein [Chloroflexota bacterium]
MLKIGVGSQGLNELPLQVAKVKGYLAEEGQDLDIVSIEANVSIAALTAGELDMINAVGSAMTAAVGGQPLKVVVFNVTAPAHFIVAQADIKSIEQLKGGNIAITNPGSALERIAVELLKNHGLQAGKDVELVSAGNPSARWTALRQKAVKAALLQFPEVIFAQNEGFNVLIRAYDEIQQPQNGVAVTDTMLQTRRAEITAFLRAYLKARKFMKANLEETIKIGAPFMEVDPEIARKSIELFRYAADGTADDKDVETYVSNKKRASELVDYGPLNEAKKAVGWP